MASGDSLIMWNAAHAALTGSSRAAGNFDADYGYYLAFDDTADEDAIFNGILGRHYASGGVTVRANFLMAGANTSANAVLGAAFQRLADGEDLSGVVSWSENTAVVAVPDAAEEAQQGTITFTDGVDMDSVAAGEPFRFRFRRVGSNGSDGASGDLRLLSIEITET